MRKFNVTVNGVAYDVEIEEIEAGATASAPATAPKTAAPKAAAPKKSTPAGGVAIKAPMPGTILKVNVTAGQAVKKGDVVAVLEAMKMENEIFAPQDGTVASVNVNKGSAVKTEDVIITLN